MEYWFIRLYLKPAELATRSHALASQSLNFTSKVAIHVQFPSTDCTTKILILILRGSGR